MFKVGQEYFTNAGLKVRIISNDAGFKPSQALSVMSSVS
jgi:hypothetical protein